MIFQWPRSFTFEYIVTITIAFAHRKNFRTKQALQLVLVTKWPRIAPSFRFEVLRLFPPISNLTEGNDSQIDLSPALELGRWTMTPEFRFGQSVQSTSIPAFAITLHTYICIINLSMFLPESFWTNQNISTTRWWENRAKQKFSRPRERYKVAFCRVSLVFYDYHWLTTIKDCGKDRNFWKYVLRLS